MYLGGAVCGDGKTEREERRRAQAAANAWRAGVMADDDLALKNIKRQEHEHQKHLCDTGMPVWNGNLDNDRQKKQYKTL